MIIRPRTVPVTLDLPRARVGLAGSIAVTKRGRSGERLPVRVDRNRRAFQKVWEHRQPNLITNAGLDQVGTSLSFRVLLTYIAVGTGSTAPAFTDTGLVAEVARTNANLSLTSNTVAYPSAGLHRYKRGVAFDFGAANGNLTEFGGYLASSGGSALTRDLFRDELGDPVVITKTSSEQLVIDYTLELTFGPTTLTAISPLTITGYGAFDMNHMFYRAQDTTNPEAGYLLSKFDNLRILPVTTFGSTYDSASGGNSVATVRPGVSQTNSSSPGSGQTMAAYVGGSHEVAMQTVAAAGTSDVTYQGFGLFRYANFADERIFYAGFGFDDPATLVQDADYRLTLNAKLAWARA